MLRGKTCFACGDFSRDNNGVTFCRQCDRHVFYCKHCDFFVAPKVDHLNSTLACSWCENAFNLEPERATQWSIAYGGDSWKMKIGVNGFGRMGRSVARAILRTKDALLVAINDPFVRINDMVNEFNLNAGQHELKIQDSNTITFGGTPVTFFRVRKPENIPWNVVEADYVVDCTGVFTNISNAESHLEGARKVIITSHSDDAPTYVAGVNEENYDPLFDDVVSTTSKLTNCIAPLAKVINNEFGIMEGFLTVHSATHKTVDIWTGSRAACGNIISCPSSTQDAEAVARMLPAFNGRLIGTTSRAPTVDVSVVDLIVRLERGNYEDIKVLIKQESEDHLKGIIGYVENDAVAENFVGDCRSCIFDSKASIAVNDNFVKLVAWFDTRFSDPDRSLNRKRERFKVFEVEPGSNRGRTVMTS